MTSVKLVSYSKASDDFEAEGLTDLQELIAFCAKVSNPASQINTETSERLIKYLIKHQHWSPLEMVNAVLEIETTRDIAHQIVRHRSFAFQEFSQRYANPKEMGDMFVHREARMQDKKNRQNSVDLDPESKEDTRLAMIWSSYQNKVMAEAKAAYEWAIENGIARSVSKEQELEKSIEYFINNKTDKKKVLAFCEKRNGANELIIKRLKASI